MTTKLEKLYSIVENYKELKMELKEDFIHQLNEKEEEIIREEILPIIGKDGENGAYPPTTHGSIHPLLN